MSCRAARPCTRNRCGPVSAARRRPRGPPAVRPAVALPRSVDEEHAGVEATVLGPSPPATGAAPAAIDRTVGPTAPDRGRRPGARPPARRCRVRGRSTTRRGSHRSRFASAHAAMTPPSVSAAPAQEPVVRPDEQVAARDPQRDRPSRGARRRDRRSRGGPRPACAARAQTSERGAVADREPRDLVVDVDDVGVRGDAEHHAAAHGRRRPARSRTGT